MSACDVLVAGAGPAGATLARLLARRGRRVMLIDAALRPTRRLEVLSPSSLPALAACGAAALLDDAAIARPCLGIKRRWGGRPEEIEDFLRHPGGRGFAIDRAAFDSALRAMALDAGVETVSGRVTGVAPSDSGFDCRVVIGGEERGIAAAVLVDATGRPAALARRLGARHVVHEHRVARLTAREPAAHAGASSWLHVEDDADGWRYSLEGPGDVRETWNVSRAGGIGEGRADASATCLSQAAGQGWIAVGDAACAFDPIASQGLSNAISSALVAAGILLSPEGLTARNAQLYADAIAATFAHSEQGRKAVYRAAAGLT